MSRPRAEKKPKKVLGPWDGYHEPEQVRQREEIIAIARKDAEWKVKGFAKFVISQGYMALAPEDRPGSARTWQQVGRDLFGAEMFNEAMKAELQRRRDART